MSTLNHLVGWRKIVVGGVLSCVALGLMACGEEDKSFSGLMDEDTTWSGEVVISGDLAVNSTLTIKPCTTVRLARGASIRTVDYGEIHSVGTEKCPITFERKEPVPYREPDSSGLRHYDSGDNWSGIVLGAGKRGENVFEYTHFKQGGNLNKAMLVVERESTVSVRHSLVEGSTTFGVILDDKADVKEFSNVRFNHSGIYDGYAMSVGYKMAGVLEGIKSDDPEGNKIFVESEDALEEDVVWKKHGIGYLVGGMLLEATLELEAGVHLLMEHRGSIVISEGGSLRSLGTAEDRVVIESGYYARKAGSWRGIVISPDAGTDNLIEHTVIRHAQSAIEGLPFSAPNLIVWARLEVRDVVIEQTSGIGVDLSMNVHLDGFSDVHFKDIDGYALWLNYDGIGSVNNLSGEGVKNEFIMISGTATRNAVWKKQAFPYYVFAGNIKADIEVDAGVEFVVPYGQIIKVYENGSFSTNGTRDEPVVFGMDLANSSALNGQYYYGIQYYVEPGDDEPSEDGPESILKHTLFKGYINSGGSGPVEIYPTRKVTLDNVKTEGFSCDVALYNGAEPPTVIETTYRLCE